ncbi:MAG: hypothetical protein DDT22_00506 [candidate division WS2 bacterium]|nr:hypothetical protein [Bacillota bacterium]MBT9174841.1 hypothetical protein [Candidatus Lithacetigena glycinireducens]
MSNWQLKTPVVFLIFNRPDTTEKVFEEIRRARPPKLLVVADGPRSDKLGEAEKCKAARAIVERVDWSCDVLTNYSDTNLGCKRRVSSGLDWVFDNVEEAIILEDDCLPHPTFFHFCEELLERYSDDERIMMISGDNFQFGRKRTQCSYYFSRYNHIWGWASWRRAWKHYDVNMKLWPEIRDGKWLDDIFCNKNTVRYWRKIFENVYQGKIDTWDYQWTFACWVQGGLSILPNSNLISNIGFGPNSTHTTEESEFSNMQIEPVNFPVNFPLVHPSFILRDGLADIFTENNHYNIHSLGKRVLNRLVRVFK